MSDPDAEDTGEDSPEATTDSETEAETKTEPETDPTPAEALVTALPADVAVPEDADDELVDRVERAPTAAARALKGLQAEYETAATEREEARDRAEELESRLARKQAEFQNYKKRQQQTLEEEKERATEALVERLVEVRDDLARALDQDQDVDIRDGVARTLEKFDRELDRENVERIEPAVGDTTDPTRHEVLASVEADQPEGQIAGVHRPGYEMAGKVIRPAQVTVSDGSASTEPADDELEADGSGA